MGRNASFGSTSENKYHSIGRYYYLKRKFDKQENCDFYST